MKGRAWRRYEREPDILFGLIFELRLEAERLPSWAEWCQDQIREIAAHLETMAYA